MRRQEAEPRFRSMLGEAGVELEGPFDAGTIRLAWEAFKRFSAIPVDGLSHRDHSDALLFQAGNFGMDAPAFGLGMLRQFSLHDEDGEYEGMEHLECSFEFGDVPELLDLSVTLWSIEVPEGEFFEWVEETPTFQMVVNGGHVPVAADLHGGEV